jgi:hypothetical protein
MATKRQCEFHEHCGNTIGAGSSTGLCSPCYAALYYWQDKTISRKMRRMKALEKYHARMEFITGVAQISTRRRRHSQRRVA